MTDTLPKSGSILDRIFSIGDLFDRPPVREPAPPLVLQPTSAKICAPEGELEKIAQEHRAAGHTVTGADKQSSISSDCINIEFKP